MRILSLNARNWNRDTDKSSPYYWKTRMKAMKTMLETIDPDIICFQEMLFPATLYIPRDYRRVGFSISHHIYVKKGIRSRLHRFRIRTEKAEVFYDGDWWLIMNVHSTWHTKKHLRDLEQITKWMNTSHVWYANCIACGDFNNQWVRADEMVEIPFAPEYSPTFKRFDDGRTSTIDHFLSAQPVGDEHPFVITHGYGAERISDHYPILLQIG